MAELLINKKRFKNNLDIITTHLKDKNKLGIVLKDNAYGHGLEEIASLAKEYGIKSVFVKNIQEACKIQNLFEHITLLYGIPNTPLPANIHPTIHSLEQIDLLPQNSKVELKINTGMNRNGIMPTQLKDAITKILHNKHDLVGIFMHNGYGDDLMQDFDDAQNLFQLLKKEVLYLAQNIGFQKPRFHSLNSSATLRSLEIDDDLVRIGIAAYGYCTANFPLEASKNLQPIASLWADRICTHHLPKGAKIGYSGVSILEKESEVSTYDIGYGDGLFRFDETKIPYYSADGYLVLQRTSMDCISVLSTKNRICIFDDVTKLAEIFHTIPHEILTRLSPFIKKTIIYE